MHAVGRVRIGLMKSATAKPTHGGRRANTGGARPGSGRKKKVVIAKPSIEALNAAFAASAPYVESAMLDLIRGVYREEQRPDGMIRVYQQPPDRAMIIEVANRFLGKVTEKRELSGPDGGAIPLIIHPPKQH